MKEYIENNKNIENEANLREDISGFFRSIMSVSLPMVILVTISGIAIAINALCGGLSDLWIAQWYRYIFPAMILISIGYLMDLITVLIYDDSKTVKLRRPRIMRPSLHAVLYWGIFAASAAVFFTSGGMNSLFVAAWFRYTLPAMACVWVGYFYSKLPWTMYRRISARPKH